MPRQARKSKESSASAAPQCETGNAAALLLQMRDNVDDALVQIRCIFQLKDFEPSGPHMAQAAHSIVNAMKAHPGNLRLQALACATLVALCALNPSIGDFQMRQFHVENRRGAIEAGGCAAVVAVMENYKENLIVVRTACMALPCMLDGCWSAGKQTERAAAKAVIAVLRIHLDNATDVLVLPAMSVLIILKSVIVGDMAKETVSVVLDVMRRHSADTMILSKGCKVLQTCLENNRENITTTALRENPGAADVIIAAIKHISNAEASDVGSSMSLEGILTDCCCVLDRLYHHATWVTPLPLGTFADADKVLLQLCEKHQWSWRLQSHALLSIACIAFHRRHSDQRFGIPLIQTVLRIMLRGQSSGEVQMSGMNVLRCIMTENRDISAQFAESEGMPQLMRLYNQHTSHPSVVFAACMLLYHMAQSNEIKVKIAMIEAGCLDVPKHAAAIDDDAHDIPFAICRLIGAFASPPNDFRMRALAVHMGVVPPLMHAMTAAKTAVEKQTLGCAALAYMLMGECIQTNDEGISFIHLDPALCRRLFPIVANALLVLSEAQTDSELEQDQHETIQAGAMHILYGLVQYAPDCIPLYGRCGVIRVIAKKLVKFAEGQELRVLNREEFVFAYVQGLSVACQNCKQNKDLSLKEGAAAALCQVIAKFKEDAYVHRTALLTLHGMAEGHEGIAALLTRKSLIRHAFHASQRETDVQCVKQGLNNMLEQMSMQTPEGQEMVKNLEERHKQKMNETCSVCAKTAREVGRERLLLCSGCTVKPLYCSAECQKTGWKAHKAECKANKKP
jgi:hypothetical protein